MQSNIFELLAESATLLLVGMSVVFIFLTTLIGAIQLIAFANSRFPVKEVEQPGARATRSNRKSQIPAGISQSTIAAITAAIHQHRKSR